MTDHRYRTDRGERSREGRGALQLQLQHRLTQTGDDRRDPHGRRRGVRRAARGHRRDPGRTRARRDQGSADDGGHDHDDRPRRRRRPARPHPLGTTTTATAAAGDLLTATGAARRRVRARRRPDATRRQATATPRSAGHRAADPAGSRPVTPAPPAAAAKPDAPKTYGDDRRRDGARERGSRRGARRRARRRDDRATPARPAPRRSPQRRPTTVSAPAVAVAASGTSDSSGTKSGSGTSDGQTTADQQPAPAPATPVTAAVDPSGTTTAIVPSTPIVQSPVAAMQAAPQPIAVPVATSVPQSLTVDRERFAQMVESLETRLRVSGAEGGKAMRMTLSPPELGGLSVRLHISADGQSATAALVAQHHETGDMLAQAAGDLQKALADRGLRLDRLDVTAGGSSPPSARTRARTALRRTHPTRASSRRAARPTRSTRAATAPPPATARPPASLRARHRPPRAGACTSSHDQARRRR